MKSDSNSRLFEYWWFTSESGTVDSFALDSFERAMNPMPCIKAVKTDEKATNAEKGVCPLRKPCLFKESMFWSRVRLAVTIFFCGILPAETVSSVAFLGLMI